MPTVYKLRNYKFVFISLIIFLSFIFWGIHQSGYGSAAKAGSHLSHYDPKVIYDGKYCFISNVFESSIKEFERITLVLHSSHDKLFGSLANHVSYRLTEICILVPRDSSESVQSESGEQQLRKNTNPSGNANLHSQIHQIISYFSGQKLGRPNIDHHFDRR